MNDKIYKLSPSDFAFLWEQCKRCFYLKVVHNITQPSMPMAGIFKKIEGLQMNFYNNKPTKEIHSDLPPGTIRCGEKWVESEIIKVPGYKTGCYIFGKFDTVIEFYDKSWGVIDFKTTDTKAEHVGLYSRQLHAYSYALELPSSQPIKLRRKPLKLNPVTKLGLLCFEPTQIKQPDTGLHSYEGKVSWIEIPRNDKNFLKFIGEVLGLLELPTPPDPSQNCNWCNYTNKLKNIF